MKKESLSRALAWVRSAFLRLPPVLLLPLGAVLISLCVLFPQVGALAWVAMLPALLYLFRQTEDGPLRFRRMYGMGFLYFLSFYLMIWHWFTDLYPMEFAGIGKWEAVGLIAICWIGLSLLQSAFAAFLFPFYIWLSHTRFPKKHPLLRPFLFAAVYTVGEWSQTLTWAGVPWGRLSLSQSDCGVLFNSAALFGSYFITFAIVACNGLLAYLILHADKRRANAIALAAVFLANLGAGIIGYAAAAPKGEGVTVAAVQGNVGSSDKWDSQSSQRSYEVYRRYTKEAAEMGAEMVVFPETFIPYRITNDSALGLYVKSLATEYDITVRCGAFWHDTENGKYYNGLFTVHPDGRIDETIYAKRRPVPFGEFVPMRPVVELLVPPLADMSMLAEDIDKGMSTAIVDTEIGKLGSLICFDSIYEDLTLSAVRDGAEVICLSTNDSWFLDSVGIYIHRRHAELRAVECGRYIVRSADTGISAIITPRGESRAEVPALVDGMSVDVIHARQSRTLYSYIGNLPIYLLIMAGAAMAADALICRQKQRKQEEAPQRDE